MRIIWRLLGFIKPFGLEVLLSVFLGIATISAGIGMLGTSAYLISMAALHPSIAELQVAIVGVRFFGISRGVFRYLERLVSHSVNLKVLTRLRVWVYAKAEIITPAGLQNDRGGELLNRVMADLETLENFFVRVVSPVLVALTITIGMSLFLGAYFLPLGIILAIGMTINGVVLPAITLILTKRTGSQVRQATANLSAEMLEMFQGLEDLQAAGAEERWLQKIDQNSQKSGKLQLFYGFLTGMNNGLTLLVVNLTLLVVLITAIPLVNAGAISGVSLAVVSLLTIASFEATNSLPQAAQNLSSSIASAKRLFDQLSVPAEVISDSLNLSLAEIRSCKQIEIRGLSFSYPGTNDVVLQNINLDITQGHITALVGPSGAGKTSLVNLLLRFWEFKSGEILIDGESIRNYSAESTRMLFGVISQSTYLFAETLRQNLLLAKPGAADSELFDVIKKVEMEPWLKSHPDGLDTWLGEQGAKLSGGEAQRLAIARVLLQDAPFILLDEPTSHLDNETEKKILEMLFRVFSGKGVLLITHHLEMLDKVGEIIFVSGGKVTERGKQFQLLASKGAYSHYWEMQHGNLE
ncbi:MAG: thiol reductant ABC exporter subunit CydC [Anaerolineaceae bacterium]